MATVEQHEALLREARQLRDAIYGPGTDAEWAKCCERWIADIEWLRANAPRRRARSDAPHLP